MKKRFGVIATIVAAASFFSLITASVAWFEARTDVDFGTGHGSTAAAYFASGSGKSEAEAYVISSPIHMYNLAWLQYLGRFNTKVSPTYFKLKNDIDMSGLNSALPPIGTEDNPFIGVFDGQGYTISNLTVSNDINQITKHPSTVQALQGVSVVGFFGIVGNPQPIGIQRGDTDLDYTELQVFDKLNLHHFNLQNVVVKSTTAQTLMGIVAGYVNGHDGTVHDIGVMNGSLQAAQGATCLQHFADDDTEDPARPISKFSLIGETEDTEWKEAYDDSGTGSGDGPGDDASFGGSMNMWDTNRRVSCILKEDFNSSTSTSSYYRTKNSGTNTYGAYLQIQQFSTSPFCVTSLGPIKSANTIATNASYATLKSGALAINTDIDTMLAGPETITTTVSGTSNIPTVTTPYYSSHTSETVLSTNTGYFTGDKPYGTDSTNGSVVFGSKKKSLITNSYNGSELKLMSNLPTSSGFITIKDDSQSSSTSAQSPDYFGYTNYNRVREGLLPVLQNANTSGFINGFRLSSESSEAPVSQAFNLTNASINGTTYSSYAVLPRGLNFMCSNKGAITLVTTGYDSTVPTAKSMFRLYSVTRNANKTSISSAIEITKVYRDSSGNITYNSGPSGSTLCYDSSKWASTLGDGYLYYCEIPVNAGEFFIGGPASGNSGYLVYLDIGANGNGGGGGTTPTGDYDLKNVRYVHQIVNNGSTDSSDDYIDILFKISTAGANGTVALYFSRHDATMLYYHQNGTATNVDVTVFIATTDNIQDTTSAVWTS